MSKVSAEVVLGVEEVRSGAYLKDESVAEFVRWFREFVVGSAPRPCSHHYFYRKSGVHRSFLTLTDAAAGYQFDISRKLTNELGIRPHPVNGNAEDNRLVLSRLSADLRAAVGKLDEVQAVLAAKRIQLWGGTQNGNNEHIDEISGNRDAGGFLGYLGRFSPVGLRSEGLVESNFRSNAGFTKIYALCFDDFVIFDSRVAASLALFVRRHLEEIGRPLTKSLTFSLMPGKGTQKTPAPNRDPSSEQIRFPQTNNNQLVHYLSNLRANVILKAVLEDAGSRYEFRRGDLQEDLRELEAALFMVGYEVQSGR